MCQYSQPTKKKKIESLVMMIRSIFVCGFFFLLLIYLSIFCQWIKFGVQMNFVCEIIINNKNEIYISFLDSIKKNFIIFFSEIISTFLNVLFSISTLTGLSSVVGFLFFFFFCLFCFEQQKQQRSSSSCSMILSGSLSD